MLWRQPAVAAVLAAATVLLCASPALAGGPPVHQGFNNGVHGQGRGKDPCDKPHLPAFCQQAPEAPAALAYPAAAVVALTFFVCLERRRRRRSLPAV